jgi:SAM-dependent methyltransferase
MRKKCRLDGYYDSWDKIIPRDATITEIGCGYGQLSFMLALLSPKRTVIGIDTDSEKIELCNHSFLCKNGNVRFVCADFASIDIPKSEIIIFNENLHDIDLQSDLLKKAEESLKDGGKILGKIKGYDKR